MRGFWTIAILFLFLAGCDRQPARLEQPEDPHGHYADQIAVAKRLLEQKEDWAERAEWEVSKADGGWKIVAWRVEHPQAKGADRYLPWGYSIIELDHRLVATDYHRKG